MNKTHPTLTRDSAEGASDAHVGPLRTAKPGAKPLWMEESDGEPDARLAEVLALPAESSERKPTHWTLNDRGDDEPSKGDGGA